MVGTVTRTRSSELINIYVSDSSSFSLVRLYCLTGAIRRRRGDGDLFEGSAEKSDRQGPRTRAT